MGASQRSKGARGEREAIAHLKQIGCLRADRRIRNREGESDITDAIPGVSFEVKYRKVVQVGTAMKQAIDQSRDCEIPAVLHRETAKPGKAAPPWLLTVQLQDLPSLLEMYRAELDRRCDARHIPF